jgi:hypothetical protein
MSVDIQKPSRNPQYESSPGYVVCMHTVMSRTRQKFDMHVFNYKKPNDVGESEQYHLKFSNSFAAWKFLDDKGR